MRNLQLLVNSLMNPAMMLADRNLAIGFGYGGRHMPRTIEGYKRLAALPDSFVSYNKANK